MFFLSLLLTCAIPDQPINSSLWYCFDDVAYRIDDDGYLMECSSDGEIRYAAYCEELSGNDWLCGEDEITIRCDDDYCIVTSGLYSIKAAVCDCSSDIES